MTTKIKFEDPSQEEAAARLAAFEKDVNKLRAQYGLARGTEDVTEQARAALRTSEVVPLAQRIEVALRERPMSIEELSRAVHEPVGKIATAIKPLRKHLFNAGTDFAPAWFWVIGDQATTPQLNAAVEALVAFRPMFNVELQAATGARQNRVNAAINVIRYKNPRIANVGTATRGRWYIVPEHVKAARLEKR